MDRNLLFLCQSSEHMGAVKRMLYSKGEPVYWGNGGEDTSCPCIAWDGNMWVGHLYPCGTVDRFLEGGRKLIDLKEHLARGGY